ncbi:hypothetical protein Tco_0984430 [Tanacetum coccineum]
MWNYNPPEHESAPAHPFLAVMNKEYDGHCRLFDRGVTNTLIKKVNGDGSASAVLREIVKSPTVSLEVEKGQSANMQLEAMQQKNDDDREKLIEDAVRKILGKLPPEFVRGFLT